MSVQAPLIPALVGPTGAGKSTVALAAARALDAEVVAVDAFTVYRGMDIGTAKPSLAERREVRHHMIDVLSPTEVCTVEWFQTAARGAIDDVLLRGRTPLLVGGSGLYFRAVVDPLEFPPTDPAVRDALLARYADHPGRAHADLLAVDPEAAARIDPANLRRSVRALEVMELTRRPFSSWHRTWDRFEPVYPGLHVVGISLDRAELTARLERRTDAMMAAGWLQECRALTSLEHAPPEAAGRPELSATARQAIGYAELLDHLAGVCSLPEAVERIKVRTRRYAVRQQRWFARDPRVQWTTAATAAERVLELCTS